jgi:hypothetical protein
VKINPKFLKWGRASVRYGRIQRMSILINTISNSIATTMVKSTGKDGQTACIPCPELVKLYNQHMGGVDLANARRKSYSCSRRSEKWWHTLFYYLLDASVVNTYIHLAERPYCAKRTTQKEFIFELSDQLMGLQCTKASTPSFWLASSLHTLYRPALHQKE